MYLENGASVMGAGTEIDKGILKLLCGSGRRKDMGGSLAQTWDRTGQNLMSVQELITQVSNILLYISFQVSIYSSLIIICA